MTVAEELLRQQKIKFISAILKLNVDAPAIAAVAEFSQAEINAIRIEISNTGAV